MKNDILRKNSAYYGLRVGWYAFLLILTFILLLILHEWFATLMLCAGAMGGWLVSDHGFTAFERHRVEQLAKMGNIDLLQRYAEVLIDVEKALENAEAD